MPIRLKENYKDIGLALDVNKVLAPVDKLVDEGTDVWVAALRAR